MEAHLLDDGDLGAVVRAGFSSSKPFPVHPPYVSPAMASSCVSPSPSTSPVPANPAPELSSRIPTVSALNGGAPAFPCFQTPPNFGLPPLCDLITPSSTSPRLSALRQRLSVADRLSAPPFLPGFDQAAPSPPIFPAPLVHPAAKQLDMGTAGARPFGGGRPAMPQSPLTSAADTAALQAKGRGFPQGFLQQFVGESSCLVGHAAANRLPDIVALNRNVGVVSAGLAQHMLPAAGLEQFKSLVEGEPSPVSGAANAPYKERGVKKRKALQKRVVHIPAPSAVSSRPGAGESVPSDLWAWRKYGQKPIKGSPHPRGYYRCSSSKGCPARKQVERNPSNPSMLVVTYTSEHNHAWPTHRINALAGSTRQPALSTAATSSQEKSPSSNNEMSPDCATNNMEEEDEPHSDDIAGDSSIGMESPEDNKLSPSFAQHQKPVLPMSGNVAGESGSGGTAVYEEGPAAMGPSPSSCPEDDPYLQESMFAEMVEEMQRQNSCNMQEEVVEEEGGAVEVDPFNLFNWSSCPNSGSSFSKVNDVTQ